MNIPLLTNSRCANRRVLVRVGFDVPTDARGTVHDTFRLERTIPTIRWLVRHGARVILMSHRGQPHGRRSRAYSMKPVARAFASLLRREVHFTARRPAALVSRSNRMQPGDVLLLENLRFDIREERNSAPFARELAALGDWYVNDDFSTSHRPHASIARLPFLLPHAAGFLLRDEIRTLDRIINSPRRPLYVVIGGAKVRDKLGTILHLLRRVDGVLLGGASASTLLHAKGYTVGTSLIDESVSRAALTPLLRSKKLFLPTDVVVASDPQASDLETVGVLSIPKKKGAFDLGPETTRRYARDLSRARSLFWAGSIGYTERRRFCVATRKLARAISARRTFSVAAGGDTVRAFRELGLMKRFSYIATGGGAALAYLAGKPLPGLEALRK